MVDLLSRALVPLSAATESHGGHGRVRVRDIGYFTKDLADAVIAGGADFAIGANRNPATWRAAASVPEDSWTDADGMAGAQVAVADYAPGGWPAGTRCLIRRVQHDAAAMSVDPRARRRKTIPADQLTLALEGDIDTVWAYSFIVTNLDITTPDKAREAERWYRHRTDIEDRIRDAKHGAALRHLPSGHREVNVAWMWGALLAVNLSACGVPCHQRRCIEQLDADGTHRRGQHRGCIKCRAASSAQSPPCYPPKREGLGGICHRAGGNTTCLLGHDRWTLGSNDDAVGGP